jgi:plastocyanin
VEVLPDNESIASQSDLSRQARDAIEQNFAEPLRQALTAADSGKLQLAGKTYNAPLAGLATDGIRSWGGLVHQRHLEHRHGSVNQFVPAEIRARPGEKVTWTFTGRHTVSFNVPEFFPIFDVAGSGRVSMNADAYQPVGFAGRPADQPPDQPADVDAGTWDGKGFRSSGLNWQAGDRFSLAFSRPGTYLLACLVHPSMVGKVVVES